VTFPYGSTEPVTVVRYPMDFVFEHGGTKRQHKLIVDAVIAFHNAVVAPHLAG
jgi:hypothetical protein